MYRKLTPKELDGELIPIGKTSLAAGLAFDSFAGRLTITPFRCGYCLTPYQAIPKSDQCHHCYGVHCWEVLTDE